VSDVRRSASARHVGRLKVVFGITLGVMALEVIAGVFSGSLALLADAGHMLTDVAGIGLALLAIFLASRPATEGRTFGWYRLEILVAVVNAMLLFAVGVWVLIEAWRRFAEPPEIRSGLMLSVAIVGLVANAISARLLMEGQRQSLNMRGAYLEVLGDLLGSAAVIVAAVVIAVTGYAAADPIASVVIGLLILPRTWHLLREAVDVLLEGHTEGCRSGRGAPAHPRDDGRVRCPRPACMDDHEWDERGLGARSHGRERRLR
jgi:cobalt-zinc-cadmium efflux system protein